MVSIFKITTENNILQNTGFEEWASRRHLTIPLVEILYIVVIFSKKQSETSFDSNSSKTNMSGMSRLPKTLVKHKKKRTRTKKKFNKLLNKLKSTRSQNNLNSDIPLESIVLPPDSPPDIVAVPNFFVSNTENYIIINDDDTLANDSVMSPTKFARKSSASVKCSTPIHKRQSLDSIILKNNLSILHNTQEEINSTKEINADSYLTIDLTSDSELDRTCRVNDTVINLVNTSEAPDCTIVSVNDSRNSINYDSDVTVIGGGPESVDAKLHRFTRGIAKMNAMEKGKLLQIIAQNVFNGCNVSRKIRSLTDIRESVTRATETVEDRFIKEVILGEAPSRNSVGSNVYNPERTSKTASGLRMIVIDGSNVAMEHKKGRVFSVEGLKICIDYFLHRGHTVKAFVPRFRCKYGKSSNPRLLDNLEREGLVIYTPSREIQGRMITSYDDRYIIQCAAEFGGIIVTGDNYRDLVNENAKWRDVINNRLLPFTWVDDMIMFPRDPLGRNGPTLETFLKHPTAPKPQSSLSFKTLW